MEKKELLSTFSTILTGFMEDMYKSYPDNSLFLLKQTSSMMLSTNPMSVVQNFMKCVEPYTEQILSKDESFFLSGAVEADITEGSYSFLLEELKKVSIIWKDPRTSEKTKKSIWKYLDVLVKLALKLTQA